MKKIFILLLLCPLANELRGQVLNKAEYFFDNDPGTGNATPISITASATINTNFSININALSTGFHNLNFRLRDNNGHWSHFQSRTFFLTPLSSVVPATKITRTEYFFDADPGEGNGTSITITQGATINQNTVVPITSLTPGFHNLNFRSHDDKGIWSHFATRTFYIVPPINSNSSTTISKAEYFFDNDPGIGNGVNIAVTPAGSINQNTVIPITSLSAGFHYLSIRVKDEKGKWSHSASRVFYILATPQTSASLKKAEYFFDTDPGAGKATPLPVTSAATQDNNFALDITSLSPGFHNLNIRYRDNRNQWSHFQTRTFYIVPTSSLGAAKLTEIEYFIDNDPALNSSAVGKSVSFTAASSIDQTFALDLTGTPKGNHVLYIKAKDENGFWSDATKATFTILSCTPPGGPTAPVSSRCGVGTVTLNATGSSGSQVFNWYDDASSSTILSTGSSFLTPSLSATRDYFVSIYDPVTLCESNRVSTSAIIKFADKPLINPSGSLSFCEGGSAILSAPAGFSQYKWSSGEITQQILVSNSGKFAVQTGDGTCLSPSSDSVTVTSVTALPKPTVTVTGSTTICGTGSVDLSGPDGVSYAWSTGATTKTITVSATGVYFLIVKSGANCPSLPSDPVAVSVLTPPCNGGGGDTNQPPDIDNKPLASQIEGVVQVDLTTLVSDADNNINFSSLRVINNETSRGVPVVIDDAYTLTISYKGTPFTGTDRITLEVCDLDGACVQKVIDIDVVGQVIVYNGLTPDGDGFNDVMLIKYVDVVDGASSNTVSIYNRWGDEVFKVKNYNNDDRVFAGNTNSGNELPSGTYFYKITFAAGKTLTGYITLKR